MLHSLLKTLLLVIACAAVVSSFADDKPTPRKQSQTVSAEPLSENAEKTALEFARAQHPELASLLDALRRSNQPAYQAALRDVSRDAERLNKLAERDADRHQLSLRIWNLDSRIRLEIARLSMSSDAEVETRLRPMLEERQSARLALLDFDYQRQKERLDKLNEQLTATRRSSADRVAAEIDRLQRLIASRSKTRTAASKPNRTKPTTRAKTSPAAGKTGATARKSKSEKSEPKK